MPWNANGGVCHMDVSGVLTLVVWIIVILSYVLQLVAKGFKRAEEEARRKVARGRARSPLEPKGLRRLEASGDARGNGEVEPMAPAERTEGSGAWWEQEFGSTELDEEYGAGLPRTGRQSLARELAEERAHEREVEMAEPYEAGSLGMEDEYSPVPMQRTVESEAFHADALMLAWEMESGLEDEAEAFERELVQDYKADAAGSWLVSDGGVRRQQVLSGIVWGAILGPPRCRKGRREGRAS